MRTLTTSRGARGAGVVLALLCAGFAGLAGAEIQVWVSSQDMADMLTPKAPVKFVGNRASSLPVVWIDPYEAYQPILGIGSSLEHATCYNLSLLPAEQREKVIADLVNPESGIGMSLMRICIGTSDFVGEPWYSYDDMPEGETDVGLEHFSIDKDRAYVLPALKIAKAKNPDLLFFASPWSPPGWMKGTGSMCGGRLLPEYYGVYAEYLAKFVEAYEAEGIPIHAITVQNEPGVTTSSYPSCFWDGETQRDFIKGHLGPAFERHGLDTEIWCFDHNFNNTAFPRAILSDSEAAKYVDGTAFHLYEGKPGAMGDFAIEFPGKPVYFTEGSTFGLFGANQIISYFANAARSYNAWVTVIDHERKPNNGPHECSPTCIILNSDTLELEYRFDYYMYGHFAKFIKPGAVRLRSAESSRDFSNIAFRNPGGSIALVVVNSGRAEQAFKIQWGHNKMALTSLGPKSMATYVWQRDGL